MNSINTANLSVRHKINENSNANTSINKDHHINFTKNLLEKYHHLLDNYNKKQLKDTFIDNTAKNKPHNNVKHGSKNVDSTINSRKSEIHMKDTGQKQNFKSISPYKPVATYARLAKKF